MDQDTEAQIRGGIEAKSKIIFFLFPNENMYCDPSLEPSRWDVLMMGRSIPFKGVLWKIISFIPSYLEHWW